MLLRESAQQPRWHGGSAPTSLVLIHLTAAFWLKYIFAGSSSEISFPKGLICKKRVLYLGLPAPKRKGTINTRGRILGYGQFMDQVMALAGLECLGCKLSIIYF